MDSTHIWPPALRLPYVYPWLPHVILKPRPSPAGFRMFAAYAQLKRARNGGGLEPRLHHGHIIYLARRGVVSHDMPADSVQFGSMHIRFGLNANSIRFAENRVM